ncbi:MAG: transketolase [Planctomycetes bacterium]|nr:transketolase [Planctomycetota bacterium]
MPLIDSKSGRIRKDYSLDELKEAARLMRGYNLAVLACAGSGHAGGTLSAMDLTAALYLKVARLDPDNPAWDGRDRIIWSTGHKAPNVYIGVGMTGAFPVENVATLRRLTSPFQGHPHWLKFPAAEASTGSLGQGLSIGVGIAMAAKLDQKNFRVYVMNGDGELQEGSIWEAAMAAGHYGLDSLVSIVDKNRLQIDGWVKDVMDVDPIADKFRAFGWHAVECDGHDLAAILRAFDEAAAVRGKPTVIIAHTTKGKGVDFMENVAGWHGKAPSLDETRKAFAQLGLDGKVDLDRMKRIADEHQKKVDAELAAKMPKFGNDYWWNRQPVMKVQMDPTRMGYGRALQESGADERVVCLGADISGSITIAKFYEGHPDRAPKGKQISRFISVGIAEQNATTIAAGLAKEGKIPTFGTYGVFASARNLDQIRTTVAYGNFNVLIAGAHGGVSVGPDGATHQALEDIANITPIPGIMAVVPCDAVETKKATLALLFQITGPKYLRFAREATPVVTTDATPFVIGKANVLRLRRVADNMIDAFETVLAEKYRGEGEKVALVANGPMVPEAMRAAWILKEEKGWDTRVVNMHTVKPLDERAVVSAAQECEVLITVEEHQIGGLAHPVAAAVLRGLGGGRAPRFGSIGVRDRFGESGAPWELVKEFEVSAEHIAALAIRLGG